MATLQIHYREKKKKTMNKTIRLSYISITCIPKIETPTNGTEKDLRKKKEKIYEIKKLTLAG